MDESHKMWIIIRENLNFVDNGRTDHEKTGGWDIFPAAGLSISLFNIDLFCENILCHPIETNDQRDGAEAGQNIPDIVSVTGIYIGRYMPIRIRRGRDRIFYFIVEEEYRKNGRSDVHDNSDPCIYADGSDQRMFAV